MIYKHRYIALFTITDRDDDCHGEGSEGSDDGYRFGNDDDDNDD